MASCLNKSSESCKQTNLLISIVCVYVCMYVCVCRHLCMKHFRITCSRGVSEASPPVCNLIGIFFPFTVHTCNCTLCSVTTASKYILNQEANTCTCKICCTWFRFSSSDICTMKCVPLIALIPSHVV